MQKIVLTHAELLQKNVCFHIPSHADSYKYQDLYMDLLILVHVQYRSETIIYVTIIHFQFINTYVY